MAVATGVIGKPESNSPPFGSRTTRPPRSLELFTGAGGLALGTHAAGFEHVAMVEWNKDACDTLRANVVSPLYSGMAQSRVLQSDVRTVDFASLGPVDLVAGGPPCQPFSIGGKHRGMSDERNMIREYIRAVRTLEPRAFILENVRGLLRPAFADYFSYVLLALSYPNLGLSAGEEWIEHYQRLQAFKSRAGGVPHYKVAYRLVNAADYGVPQTRVRVFLVGFRSDLDLTWRFPDPTHGADELRRAQWVTGEYWNEHGLPRPNSISRIVSETQGVRKPLPRARWRTTRDALVGLPEPRQDADAPGFLNHRFIPGARSYPGHTGSDLDSPAKTLKAGGHGVPGGENMLLLSDGSVRYLTVREAARIQTFPDQWRFEGSWGEIMRQLGNAVPMELAHIVARSVAECLAVFASNADRGGSRGIGPGPRTG
jgi:DNA (cytosine-5)-methyltransferase 1